MPTDLTMEDLAEIRDAVPQLDLLAIRALRRAGFDLVHRAPEPAPARKGRTVIPGPMTTSIGFSDAAE